MTATVAASTYARNVEVAEQPEHGPALLHRAQHDGHGGQDHRQQPGQQHEREVPRLGAGDEGHGEEDGDEHEGGPHVGLQHDQPHGHAG